MKRSSFFENSLILIISNIITGTLTFIFSIILSREIGPKGMGIYQLVMPLYNMFLFITGGGVTVSISKIAAEKKASGNLADLYKTMRVICIFELIWSLLVTAFLMSIAKFISSDILSDSRTLYSVFAFCPALIIISLSSVYKGVYYGLQKTLEPAAIDVVEKIVRISVMYYLVSLTVKSGIELSAASAVLSLSCGELASFILFYIAFATYKRKHPALGRPDNSFQLTYNVLRLSIPLALNGILSTVFGTVTTVLIPKRLAFSGMPYETALGLLGKLQGMALNIAFYPTVIIGAISVLIIPSISEAVTFRKDKVVTRRINSALRIASITSFSSAAIMFSMPHDLGFFFFKDGKVGDLLYILAPAIPLIYLEMTSFAILNGLGKQTNILINSTILSICDLVLIYFLLAIPSLNIKGYAINAVVSALLGLILNFWIIKNTCDYSFDFYSCLLLPLVCSSLLYIVTKYFISSLPSVPLSIIAAYFVFFIIYMPVYKLSTKRVR